MSNGIEALEANETGFAGPNLRDRVQYYRYGRLLDPLAKPLRKLESKQDSLRRLIRGSVTRCNPKLLVPGNGYSPNEEGPDSTYSGVR